MPVSQNQRLRKAAAKAAKRKAVVAEKIARERRELSISKPRHIDFANSPIVACTLTEDYETRGMGTLMVARKLSLGRYGICVFLLDTWCLGVKDAFFRVVDSDDFEAYRGGVEETASAAPVDPARARKLLRDAAAYGVSNGFPPPDDLPELERIFGDVAPAEATFVFGDGGKPHYVAGPNESFGRSEYVRSRLKEKFGPSGFRFTAPYDVFGDDEDDYDEPELLEGVAVEQLADEEAPETEPGKLPTA
jgi:hypothetical protein